jgi:hypothetical protein
MDDGTDQYGRPSDTPKADDASTSRSMLKVERSPPPPSGLTFVDVFRLNKTRNTCYRIPLITYTAAGTLLAIAEERFDAKNCPDNYNSGEPGGHNQVLRRSTDMGAYQRNYFERTDASCIPLAESTTLVTGKTWGSIIRTVGSLDNLQAVGGVDYSNPSVIEVKLPNGKNRILYHASTQNNPARPKHGYTIQMWSEDDGITFRADSVNVSQQLESGLAAAYPGATPGPIQGVQIGDKLVMCAWGSKGPHQVSAQHMGCDDCANFLYSSDNYGANWTASAPLVGQTFNECQVGALANGSVILIARQATTLKGQPHAYFITTYAPDLKSRGPIRRMTGVDTPTCEGSLAQHDGELYFAHPSNQQVRMNLTIHKSTDGGGSWPTARVIWPACTVGYSGLTATPRGLALIFEGGSDCGGSTYAFQDTWVKTTVVPYF